MKWLHHTSAALLGFFFIIAGLSHLAAYDGYVRIVPPWVPDPALAVALSGAAEMAGGFGVFFPRTRRVAGICLIVLLIVVFPANVQMAMHPELYRDMGTATAFYLRLPLQAVVIAWVWWTCLAQPSSMRRLGRSKDKEST